MVSLKTEGFPELLSGIVAKARTGSDSAEVARIALTLDGRLAEDVGLRALTSADLGVFDFLRHSPVTLDPDTDAETGDRLFLTRTGRLAVRVDGTPAPPGAHLLGGLRWGGENPDDVRSHWHCLRAETEKTLQVVRDELTLEPADRIGERIHRIEFAIVHMAPVQIYVNDRVYSSFGKASNLPGRSLSVEDPRSLLNNWRRTPVAEWALEDACFVACLNALLLSGPPVRAEEFNSAQLNPVTLQRFLIERIAGYGAQPPAEQPALTLRELETLAATCARLRRQAVAGGLVPHRIVSGLTLHKRERLMTAPVLVGDAPAPLTAQLTDLLDVAVTPDTRITSLTPAFTDLAVRLVDSPAPQGFSTAFEAAIHRLLSAAAEALDADVAMSRGPQRFESLRVEPDINPLGLRTGDFYCCVAPRQAFVDWFGADRQSLVRALAAYSARMRFNTWHYLPHTLNIVERDPVRDDWFFAPTMADVTDWSDQHHTGHVTFGVRYAIRVPFDIEFDGRPLVGLYDFRLMRVASPPFTVADLRQAVAVATILRQLYQAVAPHEPVVIDFGKPWYERFHG
jgi:hypothetical protein